MTESKRNREIVEIAPTILAETVKIRVAGYARVSSSSDDQLNSFEAQVSHYNKIIRDKENWELVEIFADDGISGVTTTHRTEFNRMIGACREGKIDRIITKSASRFSRNTLDSIGILRELKLLGVSVFFEKEGLDTSKISSENLLTLHSVFAQEESLSISRNCKKGIRMRMKEGTFCSVSVPFGYRFEEKTMVVHPEEAEIVRQIFKDYLSGKGITQIANQLLDDGIAKKNGEVVWTPTTISRILSNEKYKGDCLWQKRYNEDILPYHQKKNQGQLPQYYVKNTHEPIITELQFELVNILLSKQSEKVNLSQKTYPLSRKIKCKSCGTTYTRKVCREKVYWVCKKHHQNKENCNSERIPEAKIYGAFVSLFNKLRSNYKEILVPMATQLETIHELEQKDNAQLKALNQQIADISEQNHTMSGLMTSGILDSALFIAQTDELKGQLAKVKAEKSRLLRRIKRDKTLEKTREIIDVLEDSPEWVTQFQEEQFNELVETVLAKDGKTIEFLLINGLTLTERL